MARMTIHDIAKEAGVGKSTVSRVINGTGYVSDETRRKIEEVMKRNSYQPSSAARSLSKNESDAIGIIIPEANNPFFAEILNGVSQAVDENNFTLILCNTSNNIEKDFRSLEVMLRQRVKGLIFTPAADYSTSEQFDNLNDLLRQLRCPVVMLDRSINNLTIDGVYSDNYNSAFMATEALIKAGHRKIGIVEGDLKLSIGHERLAGYEKALKTYGLKKDERFIVPGNFDAETTYALMKELLDSGDLPTAFFISNNLSCNGFLRAVFEKGMQIPEDIAFIVFDKVIGQDVFNMKYSYVERDVQYMGRMAMRLLLKRFEKPDRTNECIIMEPTLKLLGSEKYVDRPYQ
jgi:LacI family transcriptional regulator